MKHKTILIILCLVVLIALAGCQLAMEAGQKSAFEDRLIGVFITFESLNDFDKESINQEEFTFVNGEAVFSNNRTEQDNRLYAQLSTQTRMDEVTGETYERSGYYFTGIEGISLFSPTIFEKEEDAVNGELGERLAPITQITGDDGISVPRVHTTVADEKYSIELEGTLYIGPLKKEIILYFNPVYQTQEGEVYISPTFGGWMITPENTQSEGNFGNESITGESIIEDGEKVKSYFGSVSIDIAVSHLPEKVTFVQMNEDNQLLEKEAFTPGQVPNEFAPRKDTAYIIVETHKQDGKGKTHIGRELYNPQQQQTITILEPEKKGTLKTRYVAIEWTDERIKYAD